MGHHKTINLTKHHVIPRSRSGSDLEDNLCWIDGDEHQKYHALFENRTPEEIMKYLINDFWNGYKPN